MKAQLLTIGLWIVALIALGVGVRRARSVLGVEPRARQVLWQPPPLGVLADSDSLASLADRLVQSDPFRTGRQPSSVAYDPTYAGDAPLSAAHSPPSLPALTVAGIVGGPPWTALVNGVPGRDGSASVRAGDTIAGTRVIAVARTSITLSTADTTWRLTLHVPWPR